MVTFTPEAYSELRERVASLDEPVPGVAVSWLPAQRDLIRTAEGKAVWIEPEPNRWVVVVMSLSELPFPDKISSVGDLQVYSILKVRVYNEWSFRLKAESFVCFLMTPNSALVRDAKLPPI
jgi:hypothetical protein